jgi:glycosyltransferase involved in cell wall biosynthesis
LGDRTDGTQHPNFSLVIAGPGSLPALWAGALPDRVELRNRLIDDEEAHDLFRRCSLVVLPYVDATQSALIAAAYFFKKPVLVTYAGALTEYVEPGVTGFVCEPDHPPSLARQLACAFAQPDRLQTMGASGRRWYDERRQQELTALLTLYERAAAGQPSARESTRVRLS